MKKTTLYLLLIAFIYISVHSYIHNAFDHVHDTKCSIYVLEEMSTGADIAIVAQLLLLFLGFVFFQFRLPKRQLQAQKLFSIRAPPRS